MMHMPFFLLCFLYENSNPMQTSSIQTPQTVIDLTEVQIEGEIKKPTLLYTISRQRISFPLHELINTQTSGYLSFLSQHL